MALITILPTAARPDLKKAPAGSSPAVRLYILKRRDGSIPSSRCAAPLGQFPAQSRPTSSSAR
jgi:hypothetical protein